MKTSEQLPQPVKELVLPLGYFLTRLIRAFVLLILAARGTFKTSRGIALYAVDMVHEMPGSTGVAVGLSFEHLGDNTIPPFLQALEEFGFHYGDHYVIGKKPPAHWPKPYLGVLNEKYDHVMTWYNGTMIYLVSLAKKASANGISAQWGFFDEVKFMNEQELTDEIFPIFRGNEETKKRFGHCGGYLSKCFATDKKADPSKINWLLNMRKQVDHKLNDIIISLQLDLDEIKKEYAGAGINKRKKLNGIIKQYEEKLNMLRSKAVAVIEVSAKDVIYAHGQKWYDDKKKSTKPYDFKITYGNEDPDQPGEVFYPAYSEPLHCYESAVDIDINKPLIISSDYQHSVAPIPVAQIGVLPGNDYESLNYIDFIYTIYPEGLRDAVKKLCDAYAYHDNKHVYYVYDHTATGKRVDAKEYSKIVVDELQDNGWIVTEVYTGMAPEHFQKYSDTKDWMIAKDPLQLPIRFNKTRCLKLLKSISAAPATTRMIKGQAQTVKDKRYENTAKFPNLDQSETTHSSDAFDMINDAVLKQKMISYQSTYTGFTFR